MMSVESESPQCPIGAARAVEAPGGVSAGWVAAAVIEIAALSAVAAHLPPRARLLGLFSIAVGLAGGSALGWTARGMGVTLRRAGLITTAVLLVLGHIAVSLEIWRIQRAEILSNAAGGSELLKGVLQLREAHPSPENGDAAALDSMRQMIDENQERQAEEHRDAAGFRRFLERRVSPLGTWHRPWPAVYWVVELVLSALAGTWLASRIVRTT